MKIIDRIGLVVFADLILIISVIMCLLIFGWLSPETIYEFTKNALNNPNTTKPILSIIFIF